LPKLPAKYSFARFESELGRFQLGLLMIIAAKPPAIFLMGPTASGKSALAVEMASALDAEIISVDSALVYRGMDIGTAKPSLAERGGIPHHLLDIIDPSESFSTGEFRNQALALMAEIHGRGKLPILVGGTMLYFNALTQGLAQLPTADAAIRHKLDAQLQALGKEALHQRLASIDPLAAGWRRREYMSTTRNVSNGRWRCMKSAAGLCPVFFKLNRPPSKPTHRLNSLSPRNTAKLYMIK
jgi:hypothetical protein